MNRTNGSSFFNLNSTSDRDQRISTPVDVKHHLHVDLDFNWTGEYAFQFDKKLGVGYVFVYIRLIYLLLEMTIVFLYRSFSIATIG